LPEPKKRLADRIHHDLLPRPELIAPAVPHFRELELMAKPSDLLAEQLDRFIFLTNLLALTTNLLVE
jgi:hypothetical protein